MTAVAAPDAPHDDLLTPDQTARRLNVSTVTLANWRTTGRYGLPFIRVGRRVRYRASDVEAWLERRTVASEPERA
jgi:excisionase family DNA binding protein